MSTPDLVPELELGGQAPLAIVAVPVAAAAALGALAASPARARPSFLLWDLPLRVFHWSLVACVTAAVVTGELGGAWMPWHGRAGLAIVGLLAFRIVWGVVGPPTARFAGFAPTPRRVLDYVRGRWRGIGHNPLGALAVFALLGLLALQAGTGLFGNDDIAFTGPLNRFVDDALGARLTGWHRIAADGLFVLLALHLGAIAFHVLVKRHLLVRPMVTGRAPLEPGVVPPASQTRVRGALALAVGAAAVAVGAIAWAGREPASTPSVARAVAPVAKEAPAAPAW